MVAINLQKKNWMRSIVFEGNTWNKYEELRNKDEAF